MRSIRTKFSDIASPPPSAPALQPSDMYHNCGMNPKCETVVFDPGCSLQIERRLLGLPDQDWHFHPEMELTLILAGHGRRFVGDSAEPFTAGDVVLLGPNVPHSWQDDEALAPTSTGHSIVVHFRADFLGRDFWEMPEFKHIRGLFAGAARGVSFAGEHAQRAADGLLALAQLQGAAALTQLLLVLDHLIRAAARPLASALYSYSPSGGTERRLERVYSFLKEKFREPITLAEIAKIAAMSPTAFSRYFKRTSGRNVSDFLTELRVGYAAVCLIESDRKIGDIALEAGFETLSSFNRQFLRMKKMQPRCYRSQFRQADYDEFSHGPHTAEKLQPLLLFPRRASAPFRGIDGAYDPALAEDSHFPRLIAAE